MFNIMIGILGFLCLFGNLSSLEQNASDKQLSDRLQNIIQAMNQGKLNDFVSYFTEDAEVTNPATGEAVSGREEISQFFRPRMQEIQTRGLKFVFKPSKTEFTGDDQATVQGVVELFDKGALIQRNAREAQLVKKNGEWYIHSIRDIEVAPAPQVYAHLKELEWMIGNWEDKDENVDITFKTEWDRFKNFIMQRFNMKVYGVTAMEGIQIVGWDPVEKKIRSWIYDSDGGFGAGFWSQEGNNWRVRMNYTLSDGTQGTMTNVYTKVNGKSYKFSSVDRKIGDKALPNIEPITVSKEE